MLLICFLCTAALPGFNIFASVPRHSKEGMVPATASVSSPVMFLTISSSESWTPCLQNHINTRNWSTQHQMIMGQRKKKALKWLHALATTWTRSPVRITRVSTMPPCATFASSFPFLIILAFFKIIPRQNSNQFNKSLLTRKRNQFNESSPTFYTNFLKREVEFEA